MTCKRCSLDARAGKFCANCGAKLPLVLAADWSGVYRTAGLISIIAVTGSLMTLGPVVATIAFICGTVAALAVLVPVIS